MRRVWERRVDEATAAERHHLRRCDWGPNVKGVSAAHLPFSAELPSRSLRATRSRLLHAYGLLVRREELGVQS